MWFLLICDCIIPITMIIAGWFMWKHYPKKINSFIGYRTTMSMKNSDTWNFAHKYAGKLWCKIGLIIIAPTILIHIPFWKADDDTLGTLSLIVTSLQLVLMFWSIFKTEKALKKAFNEDGTIK